MRGVVYLGLGLSVLHSLWSLLVLSSTPNLRVAEHNWVKSHSSRLAELEGELGRSEVAVLDRGRALGKQLVGGLQGAVGGGTAGPEDEGGEYGVALAEARAKVRTARLAVEQLELELERTRYDIERMGGDADALRDAADGYRSQIRTQEATDAALPVDGQRFPSKTVALQVLRVKVAAADGKTRKALDEKAALEAALEATGGRLVASKEAEKELVTAMEGLERQRAAEQTLTAKADRAWGRTRHFIEGAAQEAVRTPAVRPSSPPTRKNFNLDEVPLGEEGEEGERGGKGATEEEALEGQGELEAAGVDEDGDEGEEGPAFVAGEGGGPAEAVATGLDEDARPYSNATASGTAMSSESPLRVARRGRRWEEEGEEDPAASGDRRAAEGEVP